VSQFTDALTSSVIAGLKGLGMIAHVGVGFDNIDVATAAANGILVSNTPGVLDDTTADHAFALMLATARRVPDGDAFVRSGQWKRWNLELNIGLDVHHRTLEFWAWDALVKPWQAREWFLDARAVSQPHAASAWDRERVEGNLGGEGSVDARIRFHQHPRPAE